MVIPEFAFYINKYFLELRPKRAPASFPPENIIDPEVLTSHVSGSMLAHIRTLLQEEDALYRLKEVLKEVAEVSKDLGYLGIDRITFAGATCRE